MRRMVKLFIFREYTLTQNIETKYNYWPNSVHGCLAESLCDCKEQKVFQVRGHVLVAGVIWSHI